MMPRFVVVLVCLFPLLAHAGEWQPDPSRLFKLALSTDKAYELTSSDRSWSKSLVSNLEKRGGIVKKHSILARSECWLEINDQQVEADVFRDIDRLNLFLLVHERYLFLIDFEEKKLRVVGEGGSVSLHFPPSRNFVVAVNGFGGIPVGGTEENPSFSSSSSLQV
jgi:hypothetical protein